MIEVLKQMQEALREYHYYTIDAGLPNQSMLNKGYAAFQAGKKAIAELESQDDSYCQACDGASCTAKKGCVALSNPSQRKPLEVDKDGWFWLNKNECIHVDLIRKIEAAHGIKE